MLTRRRALATSFAAAFLPSTTFASTSSPVLVELFTSQGCSSCPAADKLAAELIRDPNTLVLSFNVDYWDYLGWKDTLAKPEYSQRQYDYAKTRNDGSVYTPQMVINGGAHVVGSNRRNVTEKIDESRAQSLFAKVKLSMTDQKISVEIPAASFSGEATLWLMAVEPKVTQKIERGENSGRDIVYVNVVRNLVPAAMWSGEAYKNTWMRDVVMTKGTRKVIAVLQEGKTGKLLGVAQA